MSRPNDESGNRAPLVAPAAPIARLSPDVASQLAAGEVVERPASALKELVENSLDAGATRIEVELEAGGIERIRVADNGGGIRREDLGLALERHATSKVAALEDLYRVASLGFRGEALASIAAVSRLTLTSRPASESTGWKIGGESAVPRPASHPSVGTTVEARDLFYNTPARRKFLRTERTELHHAIEVLRRLSLARRDVAFQARHGGRSAFRARRSAERLDEVLGRGFTSSAAPVEAEADGLHLRGWIGPGSPERQYFFLNGRAVRDRALGHARRLGLDGLVRPGEPMVSVLFLTMDPALVDVNVHPGKHEVRFARPRSVHDFLVASLRGALSGSQSFGRLHVAEDRPPERAYAPSSEGDLFAPGLPQSPATMPVSRARAGESAPSVHHPPGIRRERASGGTHRRTSHDGPAPIWSGERYAIFERGGRTLVVDLVRALEESIRATLDRASPGAPAPASPLLVPVRARVEEGALDRFNPDDVAPLGFVVRRVGPDVVSLLEVPRVLRHADPSAVARTVVETPSEGLAERLGSVASRALPADPSERQRLLALVLDGVSAPLGPPIAVELGPRELARLFAQ